MLLRSSSQTANSPKSLPARIRTAPAPPSGDGVGYSLRHGCGGAPPRKKGSRPPPEPLTALPGFLALPSFRPGGRLEGGGPCPPLFAPPAFFGYMIKAEQPAAAPALPPYACSSRLPYGRKTKNRPEQPQGAQVGRGYGLPPSLSRFSPARASGAGGKQRGRKRPATGWARQNFTLW